MSEFDTGSFEKIQSRSVFVFYVINHPSYSGLKDVFTTVFAR
jgi:hypothetical protein